MSSINGMSSSRMPRRTRVSRSLSNNSKNSVLLSFNSFGVQHIMYYRHEKEVKKCPEQLKIF